jgi:hypothetical protein
MSLEEEIVIYQFAQGVFPVDVLLDSFRELDKDEQFSLLFNLYSFEVRRKSTPADIEQATAEGSFDPGYTPCVKPNGASTFTVPEGDMAQDYKFLLHVFKAIYQRCFDQNKEDTTTWWYQDLSDADVVRGILARHEALVEELYNSPGYRSEFRSLAKLQHEHQLWRETNHRKRPSETIPRGHFATYDDLINETISMDINGGLDKYLKPKEILHGSLVKALTRSYRLNQRHVTRVVSDVFERYYRDIYPTDIQRQRYPGL